jgi:hypothetical protein
VQTSVMGAEALVEVEAVVELEVVMGSVSVVVIEALMELGAVMVMEAVFGWKRERKAGWWCSSADCHTDCCVT